MAPIRALISSGETRPASNLTVTFAGLIALNGMSNRPLGVCCNTLSELKHSTDGLPVAFVLRGVLEQPGLEEAMEFIQTIKHAWGQNYIIGGKENLPTGFMLLFKDLVRPRIYLLSGSGTLILIVQGREFSL